MEEKHIDYTEWAEEYEQTARRLLDVAYDYRQKAKDTFSIAQRGELMSKAQYYQRLCHEKLREARLLRDRTIRGGHEGLNLSDESGNVHEFVNRDL